MDCVSEHISLNTLAELFVNGYILYVSVQINRIYMSIELSRRDMNKNIEWQSTLVIMCALYQSLAMTILYDGSMTNVSYSRIFHFKNSCFSRKLSIYILVYCISCIDTMF